MNVCGATRLVLAAFIVGTAVSWLTGSDLYGWLTVAVAVGVTVIVGRARGARAACALPAGAYPRRPAETAPDQ